MIVSKAKKSAPKLKEGVHSVLIGSIYEAIGYLNIKFYNDEGFIVLAIKCNKELLNTLGKIGYMAGKVSGDTMKLNSLISARLVIVVKSGKVVSIKSALRT